MSIPGLGQIPVEPAPSRTRTISLQPFWEWRFESPHPFSSSTLSSSTSNASAAGKLLTVRLVSGTAERDGTELALHVSYTIPGAKSKILTWTGCTLEVSGECEDYVAEYGPGESPQISYLNLHHALQSRRAAAAAAGAANSQTTTTTTTTGGPRVLVCGPAASGKTTLVRTLAALAARQGSAPCVANVDPREGLLSLPGTLSAGVFGSLMDVEHGDGGTGVGASPITGPSPVPVKLPLAYYLGRDRVDEEPGMWRELVGRLAEVVERRLAEEAPVRAAGVIVDTPGVPAGKTGVDFLAHAIDEFSVNIVVVLGSARLNVELQRRYAQGKTRSGQPITVVLLDKSEGVVERDEAFMQQVAEGAIREYFYGNAKRTLSPVIQQVDFGVVAIFKIPEPSEYIADDLVLEKVDPIPDMAHWTLAVMHASVQDPVEKIRTAAVKGFVYVASVDVEKRRLKILAPIPYGLGESPLVWGRWPEPNINLLG